MNDSLLCECRMRLLWRESILEEATLQTIMREAALLLTAINQMESSHELETTVDNRRLDRLEAKLDLALHLLARALEPAEPPTVHLVKLSAEGAEWEDPTPPEEGKALVLELHPSEALPLALKLPAVALAPKPGIVRVRWTGLSETLNDALVQFVFRRHRQAIRARAA